jgi:hypothetical protein
LGFLINLLTMLGLMFNKSVRQQITTPYIISVLFSDLLFCTFLLPILATRYYTRETEANIRQPLPFTLLCEPWCFHPQPDVCHNQQNPDHNLARKIT